MALPPRSRAPNLPPRRSAPAAKRERLRMPWEHLPRGDARAIEDADIFALQALARGEANAAQQQRVLELFRDKLCETDRMSFYPGGDDGRRASDFAEGKRWPGNEIKRLLRMRPAETEKARET